MFIPPLPLPSNPNIELRFRAHTVEESLEFGDATAETEEEFTTRYLNTVQIGEVNDSAMWTVQDRRAALYWIWMNTRMKHGHSLSYTCGHCHQLHQHTFDMKDLGGELELLQVPPRIEVSIPVNGKPVEWILKPLDGRSMERLQAMYNRLPMKDSPAYRNELKNVRLVEIVLQTQLKDDPEDFEQAGEKRYSLIKTMEEYTEFAPLVASVRTMQESLRHGLPIVIQDGQPMLYAPPHVCPEKAKEGVRLTTRLYFPFRAIKYLPVSLAGLMANADS
ncbi:hypothetical protein AB6T85_21730 [Erwinia sp. ACCC 02193]|jgi:hypothetical protein|uniref:Morphogenetic protein n=1 Tax=Erwinia aeris TaxID=3239803 RepID=A0ABV4EDL2_9GAMM